MATLSKPCRPPARNLSSSSPTPPSSSAGPIIVSKCTVPPHLIRRYRNRRPSAAIWSACRTLSISTSTRTSRPYIIRRYAVRIIRAAQQYLFNWRSRLHGYRHFGIPFLPDSHTPMDLPCRPIRTLDGKVNRNRFTSLVCNDDRNSRPPTGDGFDAEVGIAIVIEPAFPEPVQVTPRPGIAAAKEIQRPRMPAMPYPDIFMQPFLEQAVA